MKCLELKPIGDDSRRDMLLGHGVYPKDIVRMFVVELCKVNGDLFVLVFGEAVYFSRFSKGKKWPIIVAGKNKILQEVELISSIGAGGDRILIGTSIGPSGIRNHLRLLGYEETYSGDLDQSNTHTPHITESLLSALQVSSLIGYRSLVYISHDADPIFILH